MNHHTNVRMDVDQFMAWSEQQPGRFELVNGEVIPMSPERAIHNLTKFRVVRALWDAIAAAGVDCTAYTDGMGVRISSKTRIEPDAAVQLGAPLDNDAKDLSAPLVVVEVLSPSTSKNDVTSKLVDYMSFPSIVHYLVVDGDAETVVHYRKMTSSQVETIILREGTISLDPPGLRLPVASFFGNH